MKLAVARLFAPATLAVPQLHCWITTLLACELLVPHVASAQTTFAALREIRVQTSFDCSALQPRPAEPCGSDGSILSSLELVGLRVSQNPRAPLLTISIKYFNSKWDWVNAETHLAVGNLIGLQGQATLGTGPTAIRMSERRWPKTQPGCDADSSYAFSLLVDLAANGIRVEAIIRNLLPSYQGHRCDSDMITDFARLGDSALPVLRLILANDSSFVLTHGAARALGGIGTPAAVREITSYLSKHPASPLAAAPFAEDMCDGLHDSRGELPPESVAFLKEQRPLFARHGPGCILLIDRLLAADAR